MTLSDARVERLSLSAAQREIWLAQQRAPESPLYRIGEYLEIHGPVDPVAFEAAMRQTIAETEPLNVRFREAAGVLEQIAEPIHDWVFPVVDVSAEADPRQAAEAWMRADLAQPMDLENGPLFSFALLKLGTRHYAWYQSCHHIVSDGYGGMLLARRVAELYTARIAQQPAAPAGFGSLRLLLERDAKYRSSADFDADRHYWAQRLADLPEPARLAALPTHAPQATVHHSAALPPEAAQRLHAAARKARTLPSALVLAATDAYLHRITGRQDVVLGLPVAARTDAELRTIPGMLSNVLPLRLAVRPDMTVTEPLRQVAQETRAMLRHQRFRGEDLARELGLPHDLRDFIGPQVNIMSFDYDLRFAGHRTTAHGLSVGLVEDLSVNVYDRADGVGLLIELHANPDLYGEDELAAHHERFSTLLEALIEPSAAERRLGGVELLGADERQRMLAASAGDVREVAVATFPELFAAQAARTPEATAVVCGREALSYAELDSRANRLAWLLIAEGVGPEHIVALALPRSAELITAIPAVLKAGAAYLPLDPNYPPERLAFMLNDATPTLLITTNGEPLPESNTKRLLLDDPALTDALNIHPDTPPPSTNPAHPAYVIYTSGSTGTPKAVLVTHTALANLATTQAQHLNITQNSRILQFASPSFDAATWETCMALTHGATLVLTPPEHLQPGPPSPAPNHPPSDGPSPTPTPTSSTTPSTPSPQAPPASSTSQAPTSPAATTTNPPSPPNASSPTPTAHPAPASTAPATPPNGDPTTNSTSPAAPTTNSKSAASASNQPKSPPHSPHTPPSTKPSSSPTNTNPATHASSPTSSPPKTPHPTPPNYETSPPNDSPTT